MERRRTFLRSAIGVATLIAGCSSNSGNSTDTQTPNVETLVITETAEAENAGDQPGTEATGSQDGKVTTPDPSIDFNVLLTGMSKCGLTCREITYTLQNRGRKDANQVTVRIQVHTGGEKVYDKTQSVGDLRARTQKTGITHQIEVGIRGGNKIKSNDGKVTTILIPESKNGTSERFSFERTLDV